MKINYLTLITALFIIACNNDKNNSGTLSYSGDGLSCKKIYLVDLNEKPITNNSFTYGQVFTVMFEEVKGFIKKDSLYFPGLKLLITNEKGDTVLFSSDIYSGFVENIGINSNVLKASITVASPMYPGKNYKADLLLWDKKSDHFLKTTFNFDVVADEGIKIKCKETSIKLAYLYDPEANQIVFTNKYPAGKEVFLIFDNLKGFKPDNDSIYYGLTIKILGNSGKIYIDQADVSEDKPFEENEFKTNFAPYFVLPNTNDNPYKVYCLLWDKRSNGSIEVELTINVVDNEKN